MVSKKKEMTFNILNETPEKPLQKALLGPYGYLTDQIDFTNYIETKFLNLNFSTTWENLSKNYVPADWKATVYLVLNDVIANTRCKLRRHRIHLEAPFCWKCGNSDKHRIKQCTISKNIWDWVLNKLTHNLSIPIEDPEELLSRPLDKKGEAGLWLVTAAVHYNIHNFWDGSLEKFKDMYLKKLRC
jgi:hypothetical protein